MPEESPEAPPESPTLVYIPCAEHVATPVEARPLVRRTEDGRSLLVVYSALSKLYAGLGDDHPWLAWPTGALGALRRSQQVELVALDLDVPDVSESP